MKRANKSVFLPLVGGLCLLGGLALVMFGLLPRPTTQPFVAPTFTPEPIVPTRTPVPSLMPSPTSTASPVLSSPTPTTSSTAVPEVRETVSSTATPLATLMTEDSALLSIVPTSPTLASAPAHFVVPAHERFRIGVSLPASAGKPHDLQSLAVGWVMDWNVRTSTALPDDVDYAQTVRLMGGVLTPDAATLTAVAAALPGETWLISNEADVRWQDNVDPATYARLYHEAYTAIKAGDASAVVAAGGIAQSTPLRLRYLDLALDAYRVAYGEALPAQAWHIHNYMLREERGAWGVDIPPGISDDTGVLYSVDDSGNLDIFRTQIYDFRRWMASRGYGGQPLLISEFGVAMPEDYGFPPERMVAFLRETWHFFLTASDVELGDPNDGGRLVQRWCWFSMGFKPYPTGDLLDSAGNWTPLGQAWISYVSD